MMIFRPAPTCRDWRSTPNIRWAFAHAQDPGECFGILDEKPVPSIYSFKNACDFVTQGTWVEVTDELFDVGL